MDAINTPVKFEVRNCQYIGRLWHSCELSIKQRPPTL